MTPSPAHETLAALLHEANQQNAVNGVESLAKWLLARGVSVASQSAAPEPPSLRERLTDDLLLAAFVAGCNAENELNDAELSPANVRKGVAAAMRAALASSVPAPDAPSLRERIEAVTPGQIEDVLDATSFAVASGKDDFAAFRAALLTVLAGEQGSPE